jgi:uracil-DNA glycosylase
MIGNDWDIKLKSVFETEEFNNFLNIIKTKYQENTCYPKYENIFNALKLTPYSNVKVVIIGQDPYHNEGQSHGLSFSVQDNVSFPPSLQNIFKELKNDLKFEIPKTGNLTKWAQEGVLLLNSILTVEANKPLSHKNLGWQVLTDYIIKLINMKEEPVVFILWGNYAKSKKALITNNKHLVLTSNHPSPLSAYKGFFGSKPFSKTNEFLKKNNIKEVNFNLN